MSQKPEKLEIAEAKQKDGTEENHKSMRMRESWCKEKGSDEAFRGDDGIRTEMPSFC
jgi:ribosomal protein L32E